LPKLDRVCFPNGRTRLLDLNRGRPAREEHRVGFRADSRIEKKQRGTLAQAMDLDDVTPWLGIERPGARA